MKRTYPLDKIFGSMGTTVGFVLGLAGLYASFQSLWGLLLLVLGAFMGFSSTATEIDFQNQRARFVNKIFGVFPVGKWIALVSDMHLGLRPTKRVHTTYSRSNRTLRQEERDFRIYLYDRNGTELFPIKKNASAQAAQEQLLALSRELGIEIRKHQAKLN